MKISVVIPVYNVQRYLKKCVDSVLAQSYQDYEIILVDDKSTDGSLELCKQYATQYPDRITLIAKERNEGVDKARFSALNVVFASNRWGGVTFLDSDDYILRDSLKYLVEAMETNNADMVLMRNARFIGPIKKSSKYSLPKQTLEHDELMERYYMQFFGCNVFPVSMWGKLYRISTLYSAQIEPTGFKRSEDLFFNLKLFPHLKKVSIIEYEGYMYRFGGSTSKYNPTLYSDYCIMNKLKFEEAYKNGFTKAYPYLVAELRYYFIAQLWQELHHNKYDRKTAIRIVDQRLRDKYLQEIMSQDYAPNNMEIDKYILAHDADKVYDIVKHGRHWTLRTKYVQILTRILCNIFRS